MIHAIIKKYFGFDSLRKDQAPIVEAMREGNDVFATLKTGGGKSLCYQATAIENHLQGKGATVVISPLISLMEDQVGTLEKLGIAAAKVNSASSGISRYTALNDMASGKLQLLYLSPEKLADEEILACLRSTNIASFVIDEAHCVSVWGQSFRPSYLKINTLIEAVEQHHGKRIQRCAFTATSKSDVTSDVSANLGLNRPVIILGNADRENITFHVERSKDKLADLLTLLDDIGDDSTLIYCATVKLTKEISRRLTEKGYNAKPYYGGLDNRIKEETQRDFANKRINLLCATNAFGMGVDIKHIRNVIHFNMPSSLENYYQEAGRAGRDGNEANAFLLYSPSDRGIQDYFINWQFPPKAVLQDVQSVIRSLTSEGAGSYSPNTIAAACIGDVDARHVNASLRILKEFGVIDYNDHTNTADIPIDYLADQEVDYATLQERERITCEKLNLMERYAKTQTCKRKFLLEYFEGNQTKKEAHCGKCSTCLNREMNNDRLSNHVRKEEIKAILTAIHDTQGRKETCLKVLQGADSPRIKKRGLDRTQAYGSLKRYSKHQLEGMFDKLEAAELITMGERIEVNKEKAAMIMDSKKIDGSILELRKQLSSKLKLPEFMIMNDKQCQEITSRLEKESLHEALSRSSINPKVIDAALNTLADRHEQAHHLGR